MGVCALLIGGAAAVPWWPAARRLLAVWRLERATASVPGGPSVLGSREGGAEAAPRRVELLPFRVARRETTVEEFVRYLNATRAQKGATPQIDYRGGRYRVRRDARRQPVAYVTWEEAQAYCRWRSAETGRRVRLPTEDEWEHAARGGISRARYPWGWGDPAERACFAKRGPVRVGSYAANPWGLYDMAGNVYEWCACAADAPLDRAPARGGSWAERDPRKLTVYHRAWFPRDYRNADVGFRVLVEAER